MAKLEVGSLAPDFTLNNQHGAPVHLADLIGQKLIVLFFYPADSSPGCTLEACSFRDSYEDFVEAGAEVIGISGGSVDSKQTFAQRHRLPFILLNDPDWSVADAYEVTKKFILFRDRKTYVIDRAGVIRHIFSSQTNVYQHQKEALDVVRQLVAEPSA